MTTKIHVIDLNFLEEKEAIASFLIETSEGLILIESGPETTFNRLTQQINSKGFDWKEIKYLLLTHIHFDHAGAAWKFAQNGTKVFVHPIGLPHLQNPEKLWNSAAMIYGEDMERLWGEMRPINKENLIAVDDGDEIKLGETTLKVWYTPGHAIHHNAYQLDDVIFTGDVAGVKIHQGPVVPPCPPPDINLKQWKASIQKLKNLDPKSLYLTHFAKVNNPSFHLFNLELMLENWANWIKPYYDNQTDPQEIIPKFKTYTKYQLIEQGVSSEDLVKYEYANPSWMSVTGLLRYWKLKEQNRI